jgi:hypothetical protein
MSYTTTADEKLSSALDDVRSAISHLSDIVVNQCSGHDDFTDTKRENINTSFHELIVIRDRLK